MNILKALLFLIFYSVSNLVLADCVYDGRDYPVGTVIDGLECQEDGSWK